MTTFTTRLSMSKYTNADHVDIVGLSNNFQILDDSYGALLLFPDTAARDAAEAVTPFGICIVGADRTSGMPYIKREGVWMTIGGGPTGPTGPEASGYRTSFLLGGM